VTNTGKALMLVNKINKPNLGITLDFGHSLAALENPAECATLAMMEGRLQQIHLNDNYRDWDHDLIPGTTAVWENIEFFYWVRKLGYNGQYCLDIYPYREDDGIKVVRTAANICHKCVKVADMLLEKNIEMSLRKGEHFEIMQSLWDMVI
jgi:xylose isomerase